MFYLGKGLTMAAPGIHQLSIKSSIATKSTMLFLAMQAHTCDFRTQEAKAEDVLTSKLACATESTLAYTKLGSHL